MVSALGLDVNPLAAELATFMTLSSPELQQLVFANASPTDGASVASAIDAVASFQSLLGMQAAGNGSDLVAVLNDLSTKLDALEGDVLLGAAGQDNHVSMGYVDSALSLLNAMSDGQRDDIASQIQTSAAADMTTLLRI